MYISIDYLAILCTETTDYMLIKLVVFYHDKGMSSASAFFCYLRARITGSTSMSLTSISLCASSSPSNRKR